MVLCFKSYVLVKKCSKIEVILSSIKISQRKNNVMVRKSCFMQFFIWPWTVTLTFDLTECSCALSHDGEYLCKVILNSLWTRHAVLGQLIVLSGIDLWVTTCVLGTTHNLNVINIYAKQEPYMIHVILCSSAKLFQNPSINDKIMDRTNCFIIFDVEVCPWPWTYTVLAHCITPKLQLSELCPLSCNCTLSWWANTPANTPSLLLIHVPLIFFK